MEILSFFDLKSVLSLSDLKSLSLGMQLRVSCAFVACLIKLNLLKYLFPAFLLWLKSAFKQQWDPKQT